MIRLRKIKAKSLKVTSGLLLLLMLLSCPPGYTWGYDLSAQIKGFVSAQVKRSDEIINPNEQRIKTSVRQGTGWIAEQYRNGFTYIESKTGLDEENSIYKAAKYYTLHNVGFNLGLVNGAGVVASELYSFVAKLPTAPERLVNFGYAYAANPGKYQEMVKNGTLAVAGTLLNPRPFLTGLYGYGKSVYLEAAKDPLTLGNLHGEAVAFGASFLVGGGQVKVVTSANKLGKVTNKLGKVTRTGQAAWLEIAPAHFKTNRGYFVPTLPGGKLSIKDLELAIDHSMKLPMTKEVVEQFAELIGADYSKARKIVISENLQTASTHILTRKVTFSKELFKDPLDLVIGTGHESIHLAQAVNNRKLLLKNHLEFEITSRVDILLGTKLSDRSFKILSDLRVVFENEAIASHEQWIRNFAQHFKNHQLIQTDEFPTGFLLVKKV
jgi:hypothetical protein